MTLLDRRISSQLTEEANKGVQITTKYRTDLNAGFGVWEWTCPCGEHIGRCILKAHLNKLCCPKCNSTFIRQHRGVYMREGVKSRRLFLMMAGKATRSG